MPSIYIPSICMASFGSFSLPSSFSNSPNLTATPILTAWLLNKQCSIHQPTRETYRTSHITVLLQFTCTLSLVVLSQFWFHQYVGLNYSWGFTFTNGKSQLLSMIPTILEYSQHPEAVSSPTDCHGLSLGTLSLAPTAKPQLLSIATSNLSFPFDKWSTTW